MPDASDPRGRAPLGWGDAFAALPLESAPADGWSRVAAQLDARATSATAAPVAAAAPRHGRRRFARNAGWLGAATAAALALVVAWPRNDIPQAVPASNDAVAASIAPAADATSEPSNATTRAPAIDRALAAGTNAPKNDATAIALPKVVEAARKPRLASRDAPAHHRASRPEAPAAGAQAAAAAQLDALYAESAQLEALLALARDDRVASASAAVLASALDAQVAGIDARLAQPGLDAAQRNALWQARVDVLRQAAGFESTQRVLASQGDVGALLVSVD
jgi:hypothetical protein